MDGLPFCGALRRPRLGTLMPLGEAAYPIKNVSDYPLDVCRDSGAKSILWPLFVREFLIVASSFQTLSLAFVRHSFCSACEPIFYPQRIVTSDSGREAENASVACVMSRGKCLSLEEARKSGNIDRFAKEHPSKADRRRFNRLLEEMSKTIKEAEEKSSQERSESSNGTRTRRFSEKT
jgi:hypothetical protein